MKNEWVERWIAALQSSKRQQTIGVLYNPSTECACAVGILAEELANAGLLARKDCIGHVREESYRLYLGFRRNDAAIADASGIGTDILSEVEYLNDAERLSFNQIAQYLRMSEKFE